MLGVFVYCGPFGFGARCDCWVSMLLLCYILYSCIFSLLLWLLLGVSVW